MQIKAVYVEKGLSEIDIEMVPSEQEENVVDCDRYLVKSSFKPTPSLGVSCSDVAEFVIEKPFLHEHLPVELARIMITKHLHCVNMAKLRLLEVDYPEKKYVIDQRTGDLSEIESELEKKQKAELGGD
jgi:hypothetical protein